MYSYVKYGADGEVVATLTSQVAFGDESHGWQLAPEDAPRVVLPPQTAEPVMVDHAALRQRAYPSIADQLDMLYHAMDTGELPKAVEFYNAISAVKARYPVGSSVLIGDLPPSQFDRRAVVDWNTPQAGVTYRLKYGAASGVVVLNEDGSGFYYLGGATYDQFTYERVDNGVVRAGVVTLSLPPVRTYDGNAELPFTFEDVFYMERGQPFIDSVSGSDRPSLYGPHVWAVETAPAFGTLTMEPDGSFEYTPTNATSNVDMFSYSLTDANGSVSRATVCLVIPSATPQPQAAPPKAKDDTFTGVAGALLEGDLSINDGPSPGTYALLMPPLFGSAQVQTTGAFVYTPRVSTARDTFVYALKNGGGESFATVTLHFTVPEGEDPPPPIEETPPMEESPPVEETPPTEESPPDRPFFITP